MNKLITNCRSCGSPDLTQFLDLGEQYISDFREDDSRPNKYPLRAVYCEECCLVQLDFNTPQPEMYHENYGFKSGISNSIRDDLDDIVTHAFQYKNDPKRWLDIASNDGTLLSFIPSDVFRVGVDPVGFLCKQATQYADRIVNEFFDCKWFDGPNGYMKFDVITSISCFYDMPDPNKFVEDVKKVLKYNGVWIIQQNYLLSTIQLDAVDNFCHEHLEYYTLKSLEFLLENHGLEVIDVSVSDVNGGSIRTVVAQKDAFPIGLSVTKQRNIETTHGLDNIKAYTKFASRVFTEVEKLKTLVNDANTLNKSVCILAASTRGATIWQAAGFGPNTITYAVERNPAKVGKYFSAIDVPIVSEDFFHEFPTDYAIVGPWFYSSEIMGREKEYTGEFILPLPKAIIVDKTRKYEEDE